MRRRGQPNAPNGGGQVEQRAEQDARAVAADLAHHHDHGPDPAMLFVLFTAGLSTVGAGGYFVAQKMPYIASRLGTSPEVLGMRLVIALVVFVRIARRWRGGFWA